MRRNVLFGADAVYNRSGSDTDTTLGSYLVWNRLAGAYLFYQSLGYKPVDVPWLVPRHVSFMTCADPARIVETSLGLDLVGSAEVSFLGVQQRSPDYCGRYVAITPCFRNEPIDELHQRYFMKVELFEGAYGTDLDSSSCGPKILLHDSDRLLTNMVDYALEYMRTVIGGTHDLRVVTTTEGYDIELNGIEVGSYGKRKGPRGDYLYGTGLAEPRFSIALAKGRSCQ